MENRHKHYSRVTVMRSDGTPWTLDHVKHLILKQGSYALYTGEHGVDRRLIIIPQERVDHLIIEEETEL